MVGPGTEEELLVDPPSRTYICGALRPINSQVGEEQNDELQEGDSEASMEGIPSLINAMWPSAMGMTVHVKPGVEHVRLRIRLALYKPVVEEESEFKSTDAHDTGPTPSPTMGGLLASLTPPPSQAESGQMKAETASRKESAKRPRVQWKRVPLSGSWVIRVAGPVNEELQPRPFVEEAEPASGLALDIRRHDHGQGAPKLLTLTLINRNQVAEDEWEKWEQSTVFQPVLEVTAGEGYDPEAFVEPPAGAGRRTDPDFLQHLLLYRHARDFATGHGCATAWARTSDVHATATRIWSEFIPDVTLPELRYDLFEAEQGPEGVRLREGVQQALPKGCQTDPPGDIFVMRHLAGG
ncbi:MAG: hypothetical protein NT069_24860, partial [Planctomycetota bacterium]|nr:hypothetical protein [Planctomycetota bacterium]